MKINSGDITIRLAQRAMIKRTDKLITRVRTDTAWLKTLPKFDQRVLVTLAYEMDTNPNHVVTPVQFSTISRYA